MCVIEIHCNNRVDPSGRGVIGIARPLASAEAKQYYASKVMYFVEERKAVYEELAHVLIDHVSKHGMPPYDTLSEIERALHP